MQLLPNNVSYIILHKYLVNFGYGIQMMNVMEFHNEEMFYLITIKAIHRIDWLIVYSLTLQSMTIGILRVRYLMGISLLSQYNMEINESNTYHQQDSPHSCYIGLIKYV